MGSAYLLSRDGEYNWTSLTLERAPRTGHSADKHPSCVELRDGRVLVIYSESSSLYQAYVSDLITFLNNSNTITSPVAIFSGINFPRATVFWGDDDSLNLIIATNGTRDTIPASTKLYKSALKDGSDWVEFSIINSLSWSISSSLGSGYMGVGTPIFFNSMWILPCPYFFPYSAGYCFASGGIYTSSDQGATWIKRYGITDTYGEYMSRNIGVINGEIWCTTYHNGSSTYSQFIKSTDGIIWSSVFTGTLMYSIFSDNNKLYMTNSSKNIWYSNSSLTGGADFLDSGFDLRGFDPHFIVINTEKRFILMRGIAGIFVSSSVIPMNKKRIRRWSTI